MLSTSFEPYLLLAKGENPLAQINIIFRQIGLPLLGIVFFLFFWSVLANKVDTSLGKFPGPQSVMEQGKNLWSEHQESRSKEAAFYERQEKRIAERKAKDPSYEGKIRPYTGAPTFIDQIGTSLVTVMAGFFLASFIAIPIGITIGLSQSLYSAANPVIQLFKPVSPLAWLPLVTMVVSAVYVSDNPAVPKSFITSMITVTLCSLWPTMINTAVGVSSVSSDLVNVSKVLRLSWFTHVQKIVLPSSIPMIFTGLRLSLGIAWMVLIAAEMLAQNPGLGKFVWDEFQNGSSASLSRIMFAVLVIGAIGFLLDRTMLTLQKFFSWDKNSTVL
jgi:nitrate/nitrite transport system permease protein